MPHPDDTCHGQFGRNWGDGPPNMFRRAEEPPSVNLNALEAQAAPALAIALHRPFGQAQEVGSSFLVDQRVPKVMLINWARRAVVPDTGTG